MSCYFMAGPKKSGRGRRWAKTAVAVGAAAAIGIGAHGAYKAGKSPNASPALRQYSENVDAGLKKLGRGGKKVASYPGTRFVAGVALTPVRAVDNFVRWNPLITTAGAAVGAYAANRATRRLSNRKVAKGAQIVSGVVGAANPGPVLLGAGIYAGVKHRRKIAKAIRTAREETEDFMRRQRTSTQRRTPPKRK
jgi:hypothetical protein